MEANYKEIIEKVVGNVINELLTEGISQELYHFCPVSSMYNIALSNEFRLTHIDRPSDKRMTSNPTGPGPEDRKQWEYYMCFSRTKSSLAGYVAMRRDKTGGANWKQSLVRIKLDGALLSSNYKGMAVNYFNNKDSKKINHNYETAKQGKTIKNINTVKDKYGGEYSKRMVVNTITPNGIKKTIIKRETPHMPDRVDNRGKKRSAVAVDYGVLDRNQMHEYEDRLFSNEPTIKNASRYIQRIDIYLCDGILKLENEASIDIIAMCNKIMEIFGDVVHIYSNMSAFEAMSDRMDIADRLKSMNRNEYSEKYGHIDDSMSTVTMTDNRYIPFYATVLGFDGIYNGWQQDTFDSAKAILDRIGFPISKDALSTIKIQIGNIEKNPDGFFTFLPQSLYKPMELVSGIKQNKYLIPLSKMENAQLQKYINVYRRNVTFITFKKYLAQGIRPGDPRINEEVEKTAHFRDERSDRMGAIEELGGYGKSVCKNIVDRGHRDGAEIFVLTDNAIIKVYNAETLRHITDLIARPEQIIDRMGSSLAKLDRDLLLQILNLARIHHENGYNYR